MKSDAVVVPDASVSQVSLTSGLYGVEIFDSGRIEIVAVFGVYNEGLVAPYGSGAPFWGDWEMYSDGVVGVTFDMQWDMTGASTPTTYSLASGTLPTGLSLSSPSGNKGILSGIPTSAGTFNFTLTATNSFGSANQAFSVIISPSASGGNSGFVN